MITSDSAAPLVVVTGATGQQGGSVVSALSASTNPYRVRGLTRDASKAGAKKLTEKGVEVVQVNLVVEDKGAVQKSFEGAHYVYCVTVGSTAFPQHPLCRGSDVYWRRLKSFRTSGNIWTYRK